MGQLLSVLPKLPFSPGSTESKDEGETHDTTIRPTEPGAEHDPQEPTGQEPLPETPALVERKEPSTYPWRLIDAQSFIYKGVIRLVRLDNFRDVDVIPISYTWSEGMKKWRERIIELGSGRTYEDRVLRGSNRLSQELAADGPDTNGTDSDSILNAHLFFTVVAFFVITRGKKFFWMDILCINQNEREEQEFFVSHMAILYRLSYETHAYPFGASIAPHVVHESVQNPVWETRAWTVQEQLQAKRIMFCYLFRGDVADSLRSIVGHRIPDDQSEVNTRLNSPVLDRFQYNGIYLLRRGEYTVTCHMEQEDPLGNLTGDIQSTSFPTSDTNNADAWNMVYKTASRSTMYKNIADVRGSGDLMARARLSLEMLPMRKSTRPEDMIYSVVGTFDMEGFVAEYDIGFEEAKLRVFENMKPTVFAYLLGVDWGSNRNGIHKDTLLPRIVDGVPTSGTAYFCPSIVDCKYERAIGTKLRCKAEKWRIWKPPMDVLSWTAVTRSLLSNDRLIIMQGTNDDQRPSIPSTSFSASSHWPSSCVRNIVLDGSLIGIKDEEYFEQTRCFEQLVDFVEIGVCNRAPLLPPVGDTEISLVALVTQQLASGNCRNMGTVLIADLTAFTSEFVDMVIE